MTVLSSRPYTKFRDVTVLTAGL